MKNFIGLLVLLMLVMTSCNKFTQFDMPYETVVVIPSSTLIDIPIDVNSPEVTTESEQTFAVEDTRKDLIEEILLTDLNLELESPSGSDFSFLKTIEIFIDADGSSEERVAWKENISENAGKTLELESTDKDLQSYIKADEFTLRVKTTTRESISQDHEIKVKANFWVDAQLTK